jgi:hypothetical protein
MLDSLPDNVVRSVSRKCGAFKQGYNADPELDRAKEYDTLHARPERQKQDFGGAKE